MNISSTIGWKLGNFLSKEKHVVWEIQQVTKEEYKKCNGILTKREKNETGNNTNTVTALASNDDTPTVEEEEEE